MPGLTDDGSAAAPGSCISSADTAWVLLSFVLVLSMFGGLGLFEASLLQAKHTISVLVQVMVGLITLSVLWDVVGFTLVYGKTQGGLIGGMEHTFLLGVPYDDCNAFAPTIPAAAFAMFQMLFAAISPLLMTGAFAERLRFWPSFILIVGWEVLVYYPVAHWVWGGGWLSTTFEVKDFAGGIVVHTTAGVGAIVCALILGPRKGFVEAGNEDPAPPSNLPMAILGCGLLFTGWFGFNAGSALSSGVVSTSAVVSTQIGGCVSGFIWMILSTCERTGLHKTTEAARRHQGPSLIALMNGTIAGLAGITPAAGFIDSQASLCLGAVIGVVTFFSVQLIKHRFGVDDALDVSSVHGVSGLIGSVGVGLLASPAADPGLTHFGAFYGGGMHLLRAQLIGVCVAAVYSAVVTTLILLGTDCVCRRCFDSSIRVSDEEEAIGLDAAEYGQVAHTPITAEADERTRGAGQREPLLPGAGSLQYM